MPELTGTSQPSQLLSAAITRKGSTHGENRATTVGSTPSVATRKDELTCESISWAGTNRYTTFNGSQDELQGPRLDTAVRKRYAKYGFKTLKNTFLQRCWRLSLACTTAANDARR
jgi:hypothetical protein